jgi:hypothetical protein
VPPPQPFEFGPPPAPGKRGRTRILQASLFLKGTGAIIGVFFGAIGYVTMGKADPHAILDPRPVKTLANAFLALAIVSAIQLVGVLATIAWKKWGVYLLIASATFSILAALKSDAGIQGAYGFIGLCLFIYAVATRWGDFED